jgi:hypothetical protein
MVLETGMVLGIGLREKSFDMQTIFLTINQPTHCHSEVSDMK